MEYSHKFHVWVHKYGYRDNSDVICEICYREERKEKRTRRKKFHEVILNLLVSYKNINEKIDIIDYLKKLLMTTEKDIDRDINIFLMVIGFVDGKNRTLREIGSIFGISANRVRQIEGKLLYKIRHPSRLGKFCSFLKKGV